MRSIFASNIQYVHIALKFKRNEKLIKASIVAIYLKHFTPKCAWSNENKYNVLRPGLLIQRETKKNGNQSTKVVFRSDENGKIMNKTVSEQSGL